MALNLSPYKLKTLKHLSFMTGCTLGSNKTSSQRCLLEHIGQRHALTKPIRVVSVDMGIRNLAYCVIDTSHQNQCSKSLSAISLNVDKWRKLDLTQQLGVDEIAPELHHDLDDIESMGTTPTSVKARLFSPANVSKLAYNVSTQLLHHKPDVILIEEQRFRSSGGSAIQEWTVRVNMLESMLWACLETLKHKAMPQDSSFPSIYSVSPARVAKFWIAGNSMALSPSPDMLDGAFAEGEPRGRAKIMKKDKIAVLQSWLNGSSSKDVSLILSQEAQSVADRFTSKSGRQSGVSASGKLDDLTDCLLQGAAWLKWQDNCHKVLHLLQTSIDR